MVAALALFMGIAAPAWFRLADPMAEDYSVHVVPFYKIDANWFAFLVVADTSYQDMNASGSPIHLTFYDAACNLVSDAVIRITTADAQFFALHDPTDANGQFNGIPTEGVILLDGHGRLKRFLTYILLFNSNNNSLIRIDSIPCQGPQGGLASEVPAMAHGCATTSTTPSPPPSGTQARSGPTSTSSAPKRT